MRWKGVLSVLHCIWDSCSWTSSTRSEKRVFLAAARERHPFLLGLHSCFQTETRVYFVMEYVSGGDLMLHIQRKQFSLRQAKFYASEVLLALEYFHANGIIYRLVTSVVRHSSRAEAQQGSEAGQHFADSRRSRKGCRLWALQRGYVAWLNHKHLLWYSRVHGSRGLLVNSCFLEAT